MLKFSPQIDLFDEHPPKVGADITAYLELDKQDAYLLAFFLWTRLQRLSFLFESGSDWAPKSREDRITQFLYRIATKLEDAVHKGNIARASQGRQPNPQYQIPGSIPGPAFDALIRLGELRVLSLGSMKQAELLMMTPEEVEQQTYDAWLEVMKWFS